MEGDGEEDDDDAEASTASLADMSVIETGASCRIFFGRRGLGGGAACTGRVGRVFIYASLSRCCLRICNPVRGSPCKPGVGGWRVRSWRLCVVVSFDGTRRGEGFGICEPNFRSVVRVGPTCFRAAARGRGGAGRARVLRWEEE